MRALYNEKIRNVVNHTTPTSRTGAIINSLMTPRKNPLIIAREIHNCIPGNAGDVHFIENVNKIPIPGITPWFDEYHYLWIDASSFRKNLSHTAVREICLPDRRIEPDPPVDAVVFCEHQIQKVEGRNIGRWAGSSGLSGSVRTSTLYLPERRGEEEES